NQLDVIITTGGTGISQRDVTIEAVRPLLTKELEGFGELFRYLSYTEDVGTRALLTRAIAGTCDNTLIFALPGSTGAIKLAIEKLIKPELSHLVFELNKDIRN
ncbi:MAG: molybdopterin-binding protein, partial [Staphylococcus epidermidis]|nr:molybdopterin-binding protein [Staphylococcus epidermidis]